MRSSVPNLTIQRSELIGATAGDRLWFNPTKTPVNDERVRQALGMLFDRKAIIEQVVFGDGWVTAGIFMPAFDWHLTEADLNQYLAFDPQKARQLFQAAGFDPNSWKPILDAGIPGGTGTVEDAEFYLSALRDVGIQAEINIVDKTEIVEHVWQQARTDFCVCNKPTFNGTNGEIFAFYHSSGIFAQPYKLLADTEFDRMIEKQSGELDPEARKAILLDVQRRVLKTAVAVPVFSRTNPIALQPQVRGYKQWSDPTGGDGHRLTEVWLAEA
jgi:peptide/nickel transport system substrate-binding protein